MFLCFLLILIGDDTGCSKRPNITAVLVDMHCGATMKPSRAAANLFESCSENLSSNRGPLSKAVCVYLQSVAT